MYVIEWSKSCDGSESLSGVMCDRSDFVSDNTSKIEIPGDPGDFVRGIEIPGIPGNFEAPGYVMYMCFVVAT